MKTLTTQDIQSISLDILDDVHQFCMEHGIRYSLAYGTLIGAIRHKGFIPWDDDIDIVMPRPDYERFCRTYKSNHFSILSEYSDDSYIQYTRIYDTEKTEYVGYAPFGRNYKGGVWIDVFALDGAETDYDDCMKRRMKMSKLRLLQVRFRDARANLARVENKRKRLRLLMKRIVYLNGVLIPFVKKVMTKTSQKIPFGSTPYCTQFGCIGILYADYQRIEDYENYQLMPFEGHLFQVCTGYDKVLRNVFGDYMELPPVEKRVSAHSFSVFIWKAPR